MTDEEYHHRLTFELDLMLAHAAWSSDFAERLKVLWAESAAVAVEIRDRESLLLTTSVEAHVDSEIPTRVRLLINLTGFIPAGGARDDLKELLYDELERFGNQQMALWEDVLSMDIGVHAGSTSELGHW